jgi:hypothetical protein
MGFGPEWGRGRGRGGEGSRIGEFGSGLRNLKLRFRNSKKGNKENIKPIAVQLLIKTVSLLLVSGHTYLAGGSL